MGGSHCNQIKMSRVSLLVVLILAAAANVTQQVERGPKLFFDSSSIASTTFSTTSVDESELKTSQLKEDVQSSSEDWSLDREGRFLGLRYWITSTSFSISTSITTTVSVDQ